MSFSYITKRSLFNRLSNPDYWRNSFNMDFFTNPYRRWPSRTQRGIKVAHDPENVGTKIYLEHDQTGGSLLIQREEKGVSITDESNAYLSLRSGKDIGIKYIPMESSEEIGLDTPHANVVELSELGLFARFFDDGSKSLFFEERKQRVDLPAPNQKKLNRLEQGRFFHFISFDESSTYEFDMPLIDLLTGVKLIVAKDFDVESDLAARNILDMSAESLERFFSHLADNAYRPEDADLPWQWQRKVDTVDLSPLEQAWKDTTEFQGYYTALPTHFSLRRTDDGFDLMTNVDRRERILSHGHILRGAMHGGSQATEMITSETSPHSILHFLSNGSTIQDHRGNDWNYIVFNSQHSATIAEQTREVVKDNFCLSGDHFCVLNFDENLCLLAMKGEALETTLRASQATIEMLNLIRNGSDDVERMLQLLDKGADLRFVDPESTFQGQTFASKMSEHNNAILLSALQERLGTRNLEPVPKSVLSFLNREMP